MAAPADFMRLARTPSKAGLSHLKIFYCHWGGSSYGVRECIQGPLESFIKSKPDVKVEVEKRKGHPYVQATFKNGISYSWSLRNETAPEVIDIMSQLSQRLGRKMNAFHGSSEVLTQTPSVQGVWRPCMFQPPVALVNRTGAPAEDVYYARQSARESLANHPHASVAFRVVDSRPDSHLVPTLVGPRHSSHTMRDLVRETSGPRVSRDAAFLAQFTGRLKFAPLNVRFAKRPSAPHASFLRPTSALVSASASDASAAAASRSSSSSSSDRSAASGLDMGSAKQRRRKFQEAVRLRKREARAAATEVQKAEKPDVSHKTL